MGYTVAMVRYWCTFRGGAKDCFSMRPCVGVCLLHAWVVPIGLMWRDE